MVSPLHSSLSNEHYTPPDVIAAVRSVLGSIDLDPASCPAANAVVGARKIFTEAEDGLARPWAGLVFLNPPGGRVANKSQQLLWWKKLVAEWRTGAVKAAVFLGFNLELLRATQASGDGAFGAMDFPFCVPRQRLRFLAHRDGRLQPQNSPTQANVIVFLPDVGSDEECVAFKRAFSPLGQVMFPSFERGRSLVAEPAP